MRRDDGVMRAGCAARDESFYVTVGVCKVSYDNQKVERTFFCGRRVVSDMVRRW